MMQTRMFSSTFLLVATLVFLAVSVAAAQVGGKSDAGPGDKWESLLNKEISVKTSIGTPLVDYVQILRQQSNGQLNVVVDSAAVNYKMPELQFSNVSIRGALALIEQISGGGITVGFDSVADGGEANMIMIRNEFAEHEQPPVVRVLNVKLLVHETPKEAILEAFDEGFKMLNFEGAKPELRFHEPSGLLFFKGSQPQVDLAMEIVSQLEQGRREQLILPSSQPRQENTGARGSGSPGNTTGK